MVLTFCRHAFLERCFPYIQQAAARNEDIVHYGDQLAICMRVLTEGAGPEDLHQRALSALDPLLTAWHEVAARQLNAAARASPASPEDVLAVIQSVHCIERCGRSFSKKRQLRDLLDWSRFTAQEYFRWCVSLRVAESAATNILCAMLTTRLFTGTHRPQLPLWPRIPLHLSILLTPSFTRISRGPSVSFWCTGSVHLHFVSGLDSLPFFCCLQMSTLDAGTSMCFRTSPCFGRTSPCSTFLGNSTPTSSTSFTM